ncbi:MAG TPA: dTMP kinase, partial [Clostridia bacterium]|nr:dTMP kinase [Clostridia bacterium]
VEGTDGCGKSTQIPMISKYLENKGYVVNVLREPGGTITGEKIREILLDPLNTDIRDMTEILLYAAARAQIMQEKIKPYLLAGEIVICDRFVDSSLAYQGYGRKVDINVIIDINKIALDGVMPDITLFFDIPPDIAMKRRLSTGYTDRIENESIEFHRRVYEGYKALAYRFKDRIKTINAQKTVDEVFNEIIIYLEEVIL